MAEPSRQGTDGVGTFDATRNGSPGSSNHPPNFDNQHHGMANRGNLNYGMPSPGVQYSMPIWPNPGPYPPGQMGSGMQYPMNPATGIPQYHMNPGFQYPVHPGMQYYPYGPGMPNPMSPPYQQTNAAQGGAFQTNTAYAPEFVGDLKSKLYEGIHPSVVNSATSTTSEATSDETHYTEADVSQWNAQSRPASRPTAAGTSAIGVSAAGGSDHFERIFSWRGASEFPEPLSWAKGVTPDLDAVPADRHSVPSTAPSHAGSLDAEVTRTEAASQDGDDVEREDDEAAEAEAAEKESQTLRRCEGDEEEDPAPPFEEGGPIAVVGQGDERVVCVRDNDGRINGLQLAVFRVPLGNAASVAKIVQQGADFLYVHDEDGFIGSGRFTGASHLDLLDTSDLAQVKDAVLKEFQIEVVVLDRLSASRDEVLDWWRRQLEYDVEQGDMKHITEIIRVQRKFDGDIDRSMELLDYICNDSSLSGELKDASRQLYNEEQKVQERSAKFGCFSPTLLETLRLTGVSDSFNAMCSTAMSNHYKTLEELFSEAGDFGVKMATSLSRLRTSPMLLRVSDQDIDVFKSLDSIAKKFAVGENLAGVFHNMWETFLKNATATEKPKALTTPIYLYLLTSFLETVTELSVRTNRAVCDNAKIRWADLDGLLQVRADSWELNSIRWPAGTNAQDRALEAEGRFLVHVMEHARPGVVLTARSINECRTCKPSSDGSWKNSYNAVRKTDNTSPDNEPVEPLVWTTVLRNGMHFLQAETLRKNEEFFRTDYEELLKSLEDAYVSYVSSCDSSESCRVTARGIVSFAAQMFGHMARMTRQCDAEILRSQKDFMRSMMDSQKHGLAFGKYLPQLIAEFVRYWENRKEFDLAVGADWTHDAFAQEIQDTCDDLHATLHAVLVNTELAPDVILDYLRVFNEFLTAFQHINFVWLVQVDPAWDADLAAEFRTTVAGKNTSHYSVTDQKGFVQTLLAAEVTVPKHYVLAIARRLTSLVSKCLEHADSDEQTRVQGTGNLLEAVRKAFIHLEDQVNYQSFEQFENDLCQPFESVASKMDQYADFKRHLDNLENFFAYTRRQNEIDIDKALEMFEASKSGSDNAVANSTDFDSEVLKESFTLYDVTFKAIIAQHYNEGVDILKTIKSTFSVHDHSQWDTAFKRKRLPVLLAAVSAIWSIRESVHVIGTDNHIKPHCIQILCILRLLNVDQEGMSLHKHLAEVLTGQGKSLVLGLLASVLALTGHSVQVVCYSEYLAKRDQDAFQDFFGALDITDKVKYGTFFDMANEVLRIEVNGTMRHARDLFRDMISNELPAAAQRRSASASVKASSILLIDEVDVFFTKEFYGNVYASCVTLGMPALAKIQEKIWSREPQSEKESAGMIVIEIQEYVNQLVAKNSDGKFTDFFTTSETLFQTHLLQMVNEAQQVRHETDDNSRFKLNDKEIITYRDSEGLYTSSLKLGYRNVFHYLRLKRDNFDTKNYRNYGYLNIGCGEVSYAELPNEYPVILGVSGTISTLSREEYNVVRHTYGIKHLSCMPTFFGKVNLSFDPNVNLRIADDEKQWQDAILRSVRHQQQRKRAVLVFFGAEADIDKFANRFKNDLTGVNKLTGNEEATQLERRIRDAGVAGSLTLALRAMGRGVDYRTSLTVEQNGGVHVVQTFLSLDVKEETQIKGRTARKDNKGSYELILCKKQLVGDGVLGQRDSNNVGYNALHAKRMRKATERYKKNEHRVRQALEKHKLSLDLIKSFAKYTPAMRSTYFSKYPFV